MNKFLTKHAGKIILMIICLFAGGITGNVFEKTVPDAAELSKMIIQDALREAIQEEIAPIKEDIKKIKEQNQVFADDIAQEWVRVMRKQYMKVQTNRDDLSWDDVEYALSKWPILPDHWITPELTAMLEYLEIKYDSHIENGGGS